MTAAGRTASCPPVTIILPPAGRDVPTLDGTSLRRTLSSFAFSVQYGMEVFWDVPRAYLACTCRSNAPPRMTGLADVLLIDLPDGVLVGTLFDTVNAQPAVEGAAIIVQDRLTTFSYTLTYTGGPAGNYDATGEPAKWNSLAGPSEPELGTVDLDGGLTQDWRWDSGEVSRAGSRMISETWSLSTKPARIVSM
jgi:hypothetical protein